MKTATGPYSRKLTYTGALFILPVLLYFIVLYWYPLISAFVMSFQETIPGLELKFAGLKTYREVFSDENFWRSLVNTLLFALQAVAADVVIALLIAIALNSIPSAGFRNVLTLFVVLPTLVSLAAAGFIWEWLFHPRFGLVNQLFGWLGLPKLKFLQDENQVISSLAVINVWVRVGFSVLILLAGLQSIPATYFDAARVDGARGFKLYWFITLPLLLPHLGAVLLLEVIFAVKVFDIVYVTTQGGPAGASDMLMLYLYNNAFRFYRIDKAAVTAVFIFVALLAFGILQRRLLAGRRYEL
jgi:multiple sugar transport system permease protein